MVGKGAPRRIDSMPFCALAATFRVLRRSGHSPISPCFAGPMKRLRDKHPEIKETRKYHPSRTVPLFLQNELAQLKPPDDHQDGMQPPCPPQHVFSVYVSCPVSRHSEPPTPKTDENRLSAHVTGRPRPPRRLQLQRKVTTQSSKWEIAHIWRIERSLRWKYRAAAWQ